MLSRSQQQQLQFNNLDFRKKQIDTLKVFNDNVVEISPYEEYCVHFDSAGRKFILIVNLGLNFPNERPTLFITPIVQHKWVNTQTGEIERAPGLLNYSAHSDLGRVVQAVVRELERFPPEILNQNSTTTTTTINSQSNLYIDGINSTTVSTQLAKSLDNNRSNYMMACTNQNNIIDASFTAPSGASESQILPNLSTLSLDELKQLDNDPEFFDDFIEEMSVVQHLNEELDSMINEVEVISRENVTKETNLIELKRKLSDDVTAIKNLGEKCDQLNKKYLKKSDEYAPQHIRELLQIAASNADTECDHHVEQFLNGKIDVQTFLNSYTHSKKLSSERKAKEERLGQQLSALERAGI